MWNGKLDAHGGVGIELALLAFSMIVAVAAKALRATSSIEANQVQCLGSVWSVAKS